MLLRIKNKITTYLHIRQFSASGKNVYIGNNVVIEHPSCIIVGDDVHISDRTWLSVVKINHQKDLPDKSEHPELKIGSGTYLGRDCVISCIDKVEIGNNVLFSDRCYIGDALHGYKNKELPIKDQYMFSPGPVKIGDNSWIGINVSILPNVTIGKHCVVGANSVVTKDIPDFHIAVGNPANKIRPIQFNE